VHPQDHAASKNPVADMKKQGARPAGTDNRENPEHCNARAETTLCQERGEVLVNPAELAGFPL